MKTKIAANLIGIAIVAFAAPGLAQTQSAAAPAAATGATTAVPAGLSVDRTPIDEIIKNAKAKAVLEAALPSIANYYDQMTGMTLAQVATMSQGAVDDAMLKAIQAEFDKLK